MMRYGLSGLLSASTMSDGSQTFGAALRPPPQPAIVNSTTAAMITRIVTSPPRREARRRTGRRAPTSRETRPPRGPAATPRRSTVPSPEGLPHRARPRGTAAAATPRRPRARGRRQSRARAAPPSSPGRSHPESCRACDVCAAPPRPRGRTEARGRSRWGDSRQPCLERIARTFGPLVAALQRHHVEVHGGQVIEQDGPRRQRPHRRERLEIAVARPADLHSADGLRFVGRQVPQLVVSHLAAEYAAQRRQRPGGAAPPAAELVLALQTDGLGERRPGPAHGAVTLPPRGRDL